MPAVAKLYMVVILLSSIGIPWVQNPDLHANLKGFGRLPPPPCITQTGILNCPDFRKRLHK
jgi:hypothetical protein